MQTLEIFVNERMIFFNIFFPILLLPEMKFLPEQICSVDFLKTLENISKTKRDMEKVWEFA